MDDPVSIFHLVRQKTKLLKRSEESGVYAIEFSPDDFSIDLLERLKGLPNLEQIQLADCEIGDDDLQYLIGLSRLTGLGLNRTQVSQAGLAQLADLPSLKTVYYNDAAVEKADLLPVGTATAD